MSGSSQFPLHVPAAPNLGRLGAQKIDFRSHCDQYVDAALEEIDGGNIFSRSGIMEHLTDPATLSAFGETLAQDVREEPTFRTALRSSLWANERIMPMIEQGRKESGYYIYPRNIERHQTVAAAVDVLLAHLVETDPTLEQIGVNSRLPRAEVHELAETVGIVPDDAYRRDLFWSIVEGHPRTSFHPEELLHVHQPHVLEPPRTISAALDRIVESCLAGGLPGIGRETTFLGLAVRAFGGRLVTGSTLSQLRRALSRDPRFQEVPDTGYAERFILLLTPEGALSPQPKLDEARQLRRTGKATVRRLLEEGVTSINGGRLTRLLGELHQGSEPLGDDEVRRIIALTPALTLPDDSESLEAAFISIDASMDAGK